MTLQIGLRLVTARELGVTFGTGRQNWRAWQREVVFLPVANCFFSLQNDGPHVNCRLRRRCELVKLNLTETAMDTGFAQNGPIKLHYRTSGARHSSEPMLLFLHGFPEFSGAWDAMLAHFGATHFCVAPDLRGFGDSDKPLEVAAYKPGALMSDIAALIRHFGRQKAIIIAHDWGGAIAWGFASRHAAMVEKLIILNAPHAVPFAHALATDPAQQRASHYMLKLRMPGMAERLRADDGRALVAMFNQPVSGHSVLTPELLATYRKNWQQPGAVEAMLNYYHVTPLLPPEPDHPGAAALALDPTQFAVPVPTLVIWGMKDQALLALLLDGLEDLVPELRIERLENAGHFCAHEEPERIAALIEDFLAG